MTRIFVQPSLAVRLCMTLPRATNRSVQHQHSFRLCGMKLQIHPRHTTQCVDGQEIRAEITLSP